MCWFSGGGLVMVLLLVDADVLAVGVEVCSKH